MVSRWSVLVSCMLLTSGALAAKPPSIEKQYKAAVKLEVSGDIAGALAAFEAIPEGKRDYPTRLHIASCKYKLHKLLEAEADWEAIRTDPKADPATIETAASELTDVRAKIPKLRIKVSPASGTLVVKLDGNVIDPAAVQRVNPGEHTVVAERGTESVFERKLEVTEATSLDVVVDAPAPSVAKPTPAPVVAPAATATDVDSKRGLKRAWPFFAGGVVFGAGFVVTRVLMGSASSAVEANCLGQHALACDYDAAGRGKVKTFETLSFVSGGLAVASIGVGVAVMLTTKSESTRTVALVPTLGTINGLAMEGTF